VRLPWRKTAVFTDLSRPRLGEHQEREARDRLRPRSSALLAVAGMGFKGAAEAPTPQHTPNRKAARDAR
jgi:hypothetical protein